MLYVQRRPRTRGGSENLTEEKTGRGLSSITSEVFKETPESARMAEPFFESGEVRKISPRRKPAEPVFELKSTERR